MAYCVLADIQKAIPDSIIIYCTDDAGDGSIDTDKVDEAIVRADEKIDSYLRKVVTVPLASPDKDIILLSVDISIYNIYSRKDADIPKVRRDSYTNAIKTLGQIRDGIMPPPGSDETSSDFATGLVKSSHLNNTAATKPMEAIL